jgi:DnaJ-class molecular chaperone
MKTKFDFYFRTSFKYYSERIKKPLTCYYKTLNVSPMSNIEEIKKEYYKLAKKYHPDTENSSNNQTVYF